MPLASKPIAEFLDSLASAEPVPGGGSVAALGGALAASLLSMVCRLTIGKKGYETVGSEMYHLLAQVEPLQSKFRELMQADIDAYSNVMDAYRLRKTNDAEKAIRTRAIQSALMHASDVPMRVAELCAQTIRLARPIAEKGNKNASSDAGVGTLMAEAGLRGAALNVTINLGSIHDESFVAEHRERLATLLTEAERDKADILRIVESRL